MVHQEIGTLYRRFRNGLILFWVFFAGTNLLQQYLAHNYLVPNMWCEYWASIFRFTLWGTWSVFMLRHILLRKKEIPKLNSRFLLRETGQLLLFFVLSYVVEATLSYTYMEQFCNAECKVPLHLHRKFFLLMTNAYITRLNYYVLVYVAIKGFAYFLRSDYERKLKELERTQLHSELSELKLQFLNMQIRPHFLFNAHHAIISLIEEGEVKAASKMLVRLSTLLRNVLQYSNRNSITLEEELDTLRNYVQLQQLRFGSAIDVRFAIDSSCHLLRVPPLLLQPVVENAFHHAFAQRGSGLLEIGVRREDDHCHITIRDNGAGVCAEALADAGYADDMWEAGSVKEASAVLPREGRVGLVNVQKRIQSYYGARARFRISRIAGGTEATFILPA